MFDIRETGLPGCLEIKPVIRKDERGFFIKTFHAEKFSELGLSTEIREQYYSSSKLGVIRGLHFQIPPHDHDKLVYCLRGSVLDAVVDLRRSSPTFGRHVTLQLDAEAGNMLYIPKGFAHGFCATSEDSIMVYNVTSVYAPDHDMGILWNSAGVNWQNAAPIVSDRDAALPPMADFNSPFA
ncbi:dTDP-4-dehydrorhamnose 3,5-epimerase [Magnetospirillum sp. 15-1]|uniref:dTDP-4-dehydrorhamnose 3,5-epimerase n=1 Tax=Magnetospirillum sp. 15-1 TaxID=1979370 RepID=UPI000BBC22FC|nr:dTDP-4-dehydrorhamnose 3,5-epimerase [Magnetospirillum sp. 15-1]